MPAHVEEINTIINRMDKEPRVAIVVHYCRAGLDTKKARSISLTLGQYRTLIDQAIWFVHIELDNGISQDLHSKNQRAINR